jgi:hypothetical protein
LHPATGGICCWRCKLVSFEQSLCLDLDQQEELKSLYCVFPVSRKKFAQLARVFTRRKKRSSAKNILSQGPAPSRDNLLLNAEPLLDDDDDDDDDSVPDSYDTMRRPEHRE